MATILLQLREAPWLDQSRALAGARVLAWASMISVSALMLLTHGGTMPDPWGRPLAPDFVSFWAAGRLALAGAPGSAWDPVMHAAAEVASLAPAAGYNNAYYAFFYPPPFLLICLPLALLPYGIAVAMWLATTGAAYIVTIRALLPPRWPALLVAVAFPAALINTAVGQNGAWSATLLGTAALQLERRPRLAGACLGILCCKPHLALLVVPALFAARRWRALAWAMGVAAILCLVSWAALHEAAWRGFMTNLAFAREALQAGGVGFAKMVSPFAAARLLGAGLTGAWITQATFSGTALLILLSVVRCRPGAPAEGAVLAVAACLATPFLLDYDLMLLAVPLAWVAAQAERGGYLPWEKLVLAGVFLLPLVVRPIATLTGIPIAPPLLIALLWVVARRASAVPVLLGRPKPFPARPWPPRSVRTQ
jgi:glycosyl transferase family 87